MSMHNRAISKNKPIILLSIVSAILLNIVYLPGWLFWLRPHFVLLVLCYWVLMLPESIGVGTAWLCGFFLDILQGTMLGQHAFALTVVVYIVSRMQLRLRLFPRWQQAVIMNLLALIYLGLLFWVQGLVSQPPMIWRYWFPMFTTGLCWPVIVQLLSRFQYRLGVH